MTAAMIFLMAHAAAAPAPFLSPRAFLAGGWVMWRGGLQERYHVTFHPAGLYEERPEGSRFVGWGFWRIHSIRGRVAEVRIEGQVQATYRIDLGTLRGTCAGWPVRFERRRP